MLPYTAHDLVNAVSQEFRRDDPSAPCPKQIAGYAPSFPPTKDLLLSAALRSARRRFVAYAR